VALAMFVLIPHNMLVLDEPSNHLDVGTVRVLTEALQEYQGTVVVVTHNREFLELLAPTHIAKVRGEPGVQTVTVEGRPLRASDWEGVPEDGGSGVPGGNRGTITLGRTKGGGGSTTLSKKGGKGGKQASVRAEEEEEQEREKYPWEMEELTSTGMAINPKGQLVSKTKKLTPQQKKAQKMKSESSHPPACVQRNDPTGPNESYPS